MIHVSTVSKCAADVWAQRTQIATTRLSEYHAIMRTTLFTFAALAAMIEFGGGGYSTPLTMMVLATTVYGALASNAALDDLDHLRKDLDDAAKASHYGQGITARNVPMLKVISAALIRVTAPAEIYTILA